jgi:hypothetical protein
MNAGLIKGLGDFNDKYILNLNFANDILIFLQADHKMVETLKLLRLSFDNLFDLKVSSSKSTLVPLSISEQEGTLYANYLGY